MDPALKHYAALNQVFYRGGVFHERSGHVDNVARRFRWFDFRKLVKSGERRLCTSRRKLFCDMPGKSVRFVAGIGHDQYFRAAGGERPRLRPRPADEKETAATIGRQLVHRSVDEACGIKRTLPAFRALRSR